jgi:hypothetical protein
MRTSHRLIVDKICAPLYTTATIDVVFLGGMAAGELADLLDVRVLVFGSTLVMVALGLLVFVLPWPGTTDMNNT